MTPKLAVGENNMIISTQTWVDGWTWKRWAGGVAALANALNDPADDELVFLGDGEPDTWLLAATRYPRAIQILNFNSAGEHLRLLGRVLYCQTDPKRKALGDHWVEVRLRSLKRTGPAPLLGALTRQLTSSLSEQEAVAKELRYFTINAARMQYPAHIAAGRDIGNIPAVSDDAPPAQNVIFTDQRFPLELPRR
jgi:hypothetical protein